MNTVVQTKAGKLEGIAEEELIMFRGIPYAAAPIGELRWQPPAPVPAWQGVKDATTFAPIPPQFVFETEDDNEIWKALRSAMSVSTEQQSEDCLYLNVWTKGLDNARRPVMVWIPGGGYHSGSGSTELYKGSTYAKRDIVVVTINYRVGALGFLNLNDITNGAIPATGNEGHLDQVAALKWVRDNIDAFGGDPDNITVFGESAGAMSIGNLLGLPAAKGTFHKAICQSGSSTQVGSLKVAKRVAQKFLDLHNLKSDDVEGLHALTEADIVNTVVGLQPKPGDAPDPELGGAAMKPVIEGNVMPELPLDAIRNGSADGVSVIVGTNLEEAKLFSMLRPEMQNLDEKGLAEQLSLSISGGWDATEIIETYKEIHTQRGLDTSPLALYNSIESDRGWWVPATRLAGALSERGQTAYNYLFTWKSPMLGGMFGACHALDLGFVWGTHSEGSLFSGEGPEVDQLAHAMQESWAAFARTGDPSCEALGDWPTYGHERNTMMFGAPSRVESDPFPDQRSAWDALPHITEGV